MSEKPETISEQNKRAARLAEMAERFAKEDAPPDGAMPDGVEPIHQGRKNALAEDGRYVDVVFEDGKFSHVEDDRGVRKGVLRWIDDGEKRRLRIPIQVKLDTSTVGQVHRGAGDTETEAARRAMMRAGSGLRLAFDAFVDDWHAGGSGLTDYELAARTKKDKAAIAPRRVDLLKLGLVEDKGGRRNSPLGNPAKVWSLTDRAIEEYRLS